MPAKKTTIEFSKEDAFAVLAILSRHLYKGNALETRGEFERCALKALCESLDNELVETFRDEYKKFIKTNK